METFLKNIIHQLNQTSAYIRELKVMVRALVRFHQGPINVDKTGQVLRGEYSNILRDISIHLVSVEYVFKA